MWYSLKSYCPICNEVIDETEFMQNEGLCVVCYENEHNRKQQNKIIRKEDTYIRANNKEYLWFLQKLTIIQRTILLYKIKNVIIKEIFKRSYDSFTEAVYNYTILAKVESGKQIEIFDYQGYNLRK